MDDAIFLKKSKFPMCPIKTSYLLKLNAHFFMACMAEGPTFGCPVVTITQTLQTDGCEVHLSHLQEN